MSVARRRYGRCNHWTLTRNNNGKQVMEAVRTPTTTELYQDLPADASISSSQYLGLQEVFHRIQHSDVQRCELIRLANSFVLVTGVEC